MKIAIIQQSNTANIAENLEKLEKNIRKAASQGTAQRSLCLSDRRSIGF